MSGLKMPAASAMLSMVSLISVSECATCSSKIAGRYASHDTISSFLNPKRSANVPENTGMQ
jgi:hypothetical protein